MSNGTEGVNKNLQPIITEKDLETLRLTRERLEKEEAEKAKKIERTERYEAVKKEIGETAWKELASVKLADGKNIETIFNEAPELLDSMSMIKVQIDTFKQLGLAKPAGGTDGGTGQQNLGDAKPGSQGGGAGSDEFTLPEYNSPEWFTALKEGKITREIVGKSNLPEGVKLNLFVMLPTKKTTVVNQDEIRAIFGR